MNNYINDSWIKENRLMNVKEGFLKGNGFQNLYNPYKNYEIQQLVATTEQEKCLYELSAITFMMHELNLYLDLHPEDQSMFMLFKDYQKQAHRMMEEYEEKYGPLLVNSDKMTQSFNWVYNEWPWEGQNV